MKTERLELRVAKETKAQLKALAAASATSMAAFIEDHVRRLYVQSFSTVKVKSAVHDAVQNAVQTPYKRKKLYEINTGVDVDVKQPLLKTLSLPLTPVVSSSVSSTPSPEAKPDYPLPTPKTDPIACLVISYKTLKGVDHDDRSWDKIHFARNTASAKKLLEVCGDFKTADKCLVDISTEFNEKGFPWSFETILRQAHEWLAKQRKPTNGPNSRQRLFDYLAKRSSTFETGNSGANASTGSVLDRFRNLSNLQPPSEANRAGSGNANEGPVVRVREGAVEAATDREPKS